MVNTSRAYIGETRDPAKQAERDETWRNYKAALKIFKHARNQWETRLRLLPEDQRTEVRRMLGVLKSPPCG